MIPVYDPLLGIRTGFFIEGRYVESPNIDALISDINNEILDHQASIIKLRRLKVISEKLKEVEVRS